MAPPSWSLSNRKDFPKANHMLPVEERLMILETAALEILISCDTCQQGLWQGTQCPELSHRILVIALSQAYPVIPLNKSFVETAKKKTSRQKKTAISPRWINVYRKLWGLDWKAAQALTESGVTPREAYTVAADVLSRQYHLKSDVIGRLITARQALPNPGLMTEGRLLFPDRRALILAAVTVRGLGQENPIEVTFEETSLVAPAYVRDPLRQRLEQRGISYTEEVPPASPVIPIGT